MGHNTSINNRASICHASATGEVYRERCAREYGYDRRPMYLDVLEKDSVCYLSKEVGLDHGSSSSSRSHLAVG